MGISSSSQRLNTSENALSTSTASMQNGYFGSVNLNSVAGSFLSIVNNDTLTAPRTIGIVVNDSSRIITLLGDTTLSGSNTGDQTITLTGDVTGSGTGSFSATLANSGVTSGTYNSVTVDAKGRVTAGSNVDPTITLTGDVTGSGTGSFATTLANSGVTAGTYNSVTVDAKGRVTTGSNKVGIADTATQNMISVNDTDITFNGNIIPAIDNTFSIGSPTKTWKDVYISANTIYVGNTTFSGTNINIQPDPNPTSITQLPTLIASKLVAEPFTYTVNGSPVHVRPSIEFHDDLGNSYPISFNTATNEFSFDALGNYGTGSIVAKKLTLNDSGNTALTVNGNITCTDTSSTLRFDGNSTLGYDSNSVVTVKGTTSFKAPVTFESAVTIGDGNDNVTINSGASNPLVITSNTLNLNSSGDLTVGRNITVNGNLTVNGTSSVIHSTTVAIGDNILILNSDIPGYQDPTLDAGIQVSRGTGAAVKFIWDETNDYWSPNGSNIGNVGTLTATTINATTINASNLVASSAAKLSTARNIQLSGEVTGNIDFDGSANVNMTTTLNNTGVVAGTYSKVAVDSKGRVTSASNITSTDVSTALTYTPADDSTVVHKAGSETISGAKTFSSQITSTVTTGTAPLSIASTTLNTNLNADLLDGQEGSYYNNLSNATGTLTTTKGGTGLSSIGTSNQILGVNNAGNALEYKSITSGTGINVSNSAGSVTVSLSRYTQTFNNNSDWGTASGGYYTITILQTAHLRGTDPIVQLFKLNGSTYSIVSSDSVNVETNGDVSIVIPNSPEMRFAGKIVIL